MKVTVCQKYNLLFFTVVFEFCQSWGNYRKLLLSPLCFCCLGYSAGRSSFHWTSVLSIQLSISMVTGEFPQCNSVFIISLILLLTASNISCSSVWISIFPPSCSLILPELIWFALPTIEAQNNALHCNASCVKVQYFLFFAQCLPFSQYTFSDYINCYCPCNGLASRHPSRSDAFYALISFQVAILVDDGWYRVPKLIGACFSC